MKKIFSLLAVFMFIGSSLKINANTHSTLYNHEPCIEIAFALEEQYGIEMSYETFSEFVEKCKKWPTWNSCGC